jgi:hypothetical protein
MKCNAFNGGIAASFGLSAIMLVAIAAPAFGQFYTENFNDWSATDFNNGYCEVRWCYADDLTSAVSCSPSVSMRLLNSTDDVIIWVHFGNKGCTGVRIDLNYAQWQPTSQPLPDTSDAALKYATSTSDTLSCTTSVNGAAALLNRTYPNGGSPICYAATHTITLTSSHRSVYWKFDKGTYPSALYIDDIAVTLIGCQCAAGACVTELNQNFGTIFYSGTVCSLFPHTFESCTGAGPYISSGTACGGTGDEVMTFGTGYPYSEATLRCLNLTGLAQASLRFNYTKANSSLGPYVYASLDQTNWTNVWSAPFTFPGGCVPACIDLAAYVGQAQVWIKFSSGNSSPSHGIDDIQLVRGDDCPCVAPTANAGLDKALCRTTTIVLDGNASGGSGGLCPGNYSPSWTGPGIVSGGNTFTPTVNAPGTYTLTVSCDTCQAQDTVQVFASQTVGDINADGLINGLDIQVFVNVLLGSDTHPGHRCAADIDGLNGPDLNDVSGFVLQLLQTP